MRSERLSPSDMSSLRRRAGADPRPRRGDDADGGRAARQLEELLEHVDARLAPRAALSPARHPHVAQPHQPRWADDPGFDLRWHVRHTALPRPGTMAQLRDYVGRVMSEPLDFDRPLWQLYLIEGLEGGRTRTSRRPTTRSSTASRRSTWGRSCSTRIPRAPRSPIAEEPPEPDAPSPEMLFVRAASERIRAPLRRAPARRRGARSRCPAETASRVMRHAEGFAELAVGRPELPAELRSTSRSAATAASRFVRRRAAGAQGRPRRSGATVNDVILAVVGRRAAAVPRRARRGAPRVPRRARPGQHPAARRAPRARQPDLDDPRPPAARGRADPRGRLERIRAETARIKQSEQARAASLIIEATRVDAADDQPRARRRRSRAAGLQPRRLQRPRARRCPSTCSAGR